MKEIIEFGVLIIFLIVSLKILITLILNKLIKKANKSELTVSLFLILLLESIFMISSIMNLTNKNYVLFYSGFILLILYLSISLVNNILFLNRYLLVTSSFNMIVTLILKFIDKENIYFNYLRTLLLSPYSNTNEINYSFIFIAYLIIFIICLVNIIRVHLKAKNEQI